MRLYHFTSAQFALQDIQHRRLKIAEVKDLNDPFDLRAPRLRNRAERRAWQRWRDEMGGRFGMMCFSPHWRNVTMWSHYADKHRGMCLGFDIADHLVQKVNYTDFRPEIDLSRPPTESDLQPMLFLKSTDWAYEREFRVWTRLDTPTVVDDRSLYFHPFNDEIKLAEIIVGPLCTLRRADVEPLLRDYAEIPSLLKARHAFKSFEVVRQRLGLR